MSYSWFKHRHKKNKRLTIQLIYHHPLQKKKFRSVNANITIYALMISLVSTHKIMILALLYLLLYSYTDRRFILLEEICKAKLKFP